MVYWLGRSKHDNSSLSLDPVNHIHPSVGLPRPEDPRHEAKVTMVKIAPQNWTHFGAQDVSFCSFWSSSNRRRANVQQLTCKIDLSNSFYYFFVSFVLLELKPFVFKGKVLGEKF